jgi:pilus assembly protein CpaC
MTTRRAAGAAAALRIRRPGGSAARVIRGSGLRAFSALLAAMLLAAPVAAAAPAGMPAEMRRVGLTVRPMPEEQNRAAPDWRDAKQAAWRPARIGTASARAVAKDIIPVQAAPAFPTQSGARTGRGTGPFGGPDPAGRPGLTVQAPGLPAIVQPPQPEPAARRSAAPVVPMTLEAGSGRLVQLPAPAMTVMAADPRVLRVQPASPTNLFIMGVAAGRTNVIATGEDGVPVIEYDITVVSSRQTAGAPVTSAALPPAPPLNAAAVESMIRRLVRGAQGVRVAALGSNGLVLSGQVPSAAEAQRAEAIARAYAGEDRPVLNDLALLSSVQVNLRVRVAEISRTITRELGFNWLALTNEAASWSIGLRTGAAGVLRDAITGRSLATDAAPGRYGIRYSSSGSDVNAIIDALAGDQLITILAEPNLTAQSGEVASFLVGGEFPIPVAASAITSAITIEFKPFGVSLSFVPTVLSPERLNLRVRPEVSELSESGAISLPLGSGIVRIPALTVRRAETTVELGTGQSFAIAGLLQRSNAIVGSTLLGLGDIPILGALFRSDRFRRAETELVIIVTPYLVRPVGDPAALAAPTDGFRPATDLDRILFRRQIARGAPAATPRLPADAGFIVE